MKKLSLFLIIPVILTTSTAMAYEICGNSTDGFVLKCNDGHTNTSTYPPNHNSATAFCEDHGGVAAGYPKPINQLAKAELEALSVCGSGEGEDRILRKRPGRTKAAPATDYNSSRSNNF